MADKTAIQWTDASWNPVVGCEIVSPGCTNCYAMKMAARLEAMGVAHYAGTTRKVNGHAVWTGQINTAPDSILTQPLRWKRPRRIFVNSMSDLFAEGVDDATIDKVFAVMTLAPQHTFQVLTKRPERMRKYLMHHQRGALIIDAMPEGPIPKPLPAGLHWPYTPRPNIWLGVSAEDQRRADERIPILLDTPAAKRFISAEPLLGPLNLQPFMELCHASRDGDCNARSCPQLRDDEPRASGRHCPIDRWHDVEPEDRPVTLDWVIVGGESGPDARPMHPAWARQIRDDCADAGVAFFMKQMGEWLHMPERAHFKELAAEAWRRVASDVLGVRPALMFKVGKRVAGRRLDGVEHDGTPA